MVGPEDPRAVLRGDPRPAPRLRPRPPASAPPPRPAPPRPLSAVAPAATGGSCGGEVSPGRSRREVVKSWRSSSERGAHIPRVPTPLHLLVPRFSPRSPPVSSSPCSGSPGEVRTRSFSFGAFSLRSSAPGTRLPAVSQSRRSLPPPGMWQQGLRHPLLLFALTPVFAPQPHRSFGLVAFRWLF